MIYATAVTCTKASILTFYGRIFQFRWTFWLCLFFVIGYWITIIVTISVACRPLPYFWLVYTNPTTAQGTCIDVPTFFFANGIAAMLIDVFILVIPIPIVYGLQMRLSQKVAVSGILLLGSLYDLLLFRMSLLSLLLLTRLTVIVFVSPVSAALSPCRKTPTAPMPHGRWPRCSFGHPLSHSWASSALVSLPSGPTFAEGGLQCEPAADRLVDLGILRAPIGPEAKRLGFGSIPRKCRRRTRCTLSISSGVWMRSS